MTEREAEGSTVDVDIRVTVPAAFPKKWPGKTRTKASENYKLPILEHNIQLTLHSVCLCVDHFCGDGGVSVTVTSETPTADFRSRNAGNFKSFLSGENSKLCTRPWPRQARGYSKWEVSVFVVFDSAYLCDLSWPIFDNLLHFRVLKFKCPISSFLAILLAVAAYLR